MDKHQEVVPHNPAPFRAGPQIYTGMPLNGMAAPEREEAKGIAWAQVLWKRKWWILLFGILGAMAGFTWVVVAPPLYTAVAVVELVGMNESFMGMDRVDPQAGTGSYAATTGNIQTQTRILMGGALRGRVVERVSLEMTPITSTPQDIFSKIRNRLNVLPQEPVELMRKAIQQSALSARARGVGVSRLIELSCESISPQVAAGYVNALANEYISQNTQFRSNSALRTSQWMEGQLEESKNRVEQAENKLRDFMRKSGNTFVLDSATLDDSKLRQLQGELSASQADRITKQAKWELAKSSPVDSLPEILDDGRMKEMRTRLGELRRERAQLLTVYTPEYVKVQALDAQIAELERTFHRERQNLVQRVQNEYDASVKREAMLLSAYRKQSGVLGGQADKAAEFVGLKREAEMSRQVAANLTQQLNQASMVAALPNNNVRIVELANPINEPVRPKPVRDIPLGAAAGLVLGMGLFVSLEMRRTKKLSGMFAAPGSSGRVLNLPELGVIPMAPVSEPKRRFALPKWKGGKAQDNGNDSDKALVKAHQGTSLYAESFRYALASLIARNGMKTQSVVVITSPGPGEGKSTFASNLAVAAAAIGQKVAVIDADLRRPRLHHIFGTPEGPGLRDILEQGNAEVPVDMEACLHSTQFPNLQLIPAGGETHFDPVKLFFSRQLPILLEVLRQRFDTVLIDCAPAMYFTDARLLGTLSDGVVLVVRAGVTSQQSAKIVAQGLQDHGAKVIGTILNDWDPGESSGYYNRYARYYSYSGDKKS